MNENMHHCVTVLHGIGLRTCRFICFMFDLKAHNVKAPLGSWACIHSRKNLHIGEMNWSIFSMKVSPTIG